MPGSAEGPYPPLQSELSDGRVIRCVLGVIPRSLHWAPQQTGHAKFGNQTIVRTLRRSDRENHVRRGSKNGTSDTRRKSSLIQWFRNASGVTPGTLSGRFPSGALRKTLSPCITASFWFFRFTPARRLPAMGCGLRIIGRTDTDMQPFYGSHEGRFAPLSWFAEIRAGSTTFQTEPLAGRFTAGTPLGGDFRRDSWARHTAAGITICSLR
jgi:hypothetical protein